MPLTSMLAGEVRCLTRRKSRSPTGCLQPFRLTPQRVAVCEVVREAMDHPTARDVDNRVKSGDRAIGFATVYRTSACSSRMG